MRGIAARITVTCIALKAFPAYPQSDLTAAGPEALGARAHYRLIDLGTLGGIYADGQGITGAGEVFGEIVTGSNMFQLYSWSAREGLVNLLSFAGYGAFVSDVSERGDVVGTIIPGLGGRERAFVVPHEDGVVLIDLPGLPQCTSASAVNNHGRVVGGTCTRRAFSWTAADGLLDIGTLGGTSASAFDVNDAGQIVGWSAPAGDQVHHAFLWTGREGMSDLGTLGGPSSSATGMNDRGAVIGVADTADSSRHAFFWSARSGMVDIGTLGGGKSEAKMISPDGVVIGTADTAETAASGEAVRHAFAWSPRLGLVDLGALAPAGWSSTASWINARRQIVGTISGSERHAVIWEPSSH